METKNKTLEDLCPFAKICAESDYRDEEICRNDYETCRNYRLFKKEEGMKTTGDIVIEKLPPGICDGAIETYPERYLRGWKYSIVGIGGDYRYRENPGLKLL